MPARLQSGSRAKTELTGNDARPPEAVEREWLSVDETDRRDATQAKERTRRAVVVVVPAAVVAALLPSIFPLTPGFSQASTIAAVIAAAVAASIAIGVVPLTDGVARGLRGAGAGEVFVVAAALFSAGAAAIHFAVAKMHFDEYVLFGVFFVGSGIAQLVWPIWVLFRRWRPLFLLAAVGNAAIVALWAVDRIWGLPLGPTPWKPDPIGFGDTVTAAFEVLVVLTSLRVLITGPGARVSRLSVVGLTLGVIVLTTLSLLSVLGVGSSLLTPTQ